MFRHSTMPFAALMILAGLATASAASQEVIFNARGALIQGPGGTWHQYNRVHGAITAPPLAAPVPLDHAKGSIY